jgi:molecular chaperone GrpE
MPIIKKFSDINFTDVANGIKCKNILDSSSLDDNRIIIDYYETSPKSSLDFSNNENDITWIQILSGRIDTYYPNTYIPGRRVDDTKIIFITAEKKIKVELAEEKDKFLRLFAEFENYKRRTLKERIELFSTANQDVIKSLLPVLDDFDRALLEMSKYDETELSKGVKLIKNKFQSTLEQKGLSVIGIDKGDVFNADDHEAVTQIPAPNEDLKGKIIDVIEKGYKLGEKVIRFPKVVIGQ